jgi:hypothetical protein
MSFDQLRYEHGFDHTLAAQNRSRSELGVASAQPILTCQFDLAHSDSEKHWMWGLLHHSVTMFAGDRPYDRNGFRSAPPNAHARHYLGERAGLRFWDRERQSAITVNRAETGSVTGAVTGSVTGPVTATAV